MTPSTSASSRGIATVASIVPVRDQVEAGSLECSFLGPEDFTRFAREQDTITVDWLRTLGFLQ